MVPSALRSNSRTPVSRDDRGHDTIAGFCKSAPLEEVRKHGHVLTPGRYVGAEAVEDDGEPFEEKMRRLTATLREEQAEGARLDEAIAANLRKLGFQQLVIITSRDM